MSDPLHHYQKAKNLFRLSLESSNKGKKTSENRWMKEIRRVLEVGKQRNFRSFGTETLSSFFESKNA